MTSVHWVIESFAAGATLYAIRDLWRYRDRDDDVGRSHRRSSIGLILLLLSIPVRDLIDHVELSTSVAWLIAGLGILGIGMRALGYHWLYDRRTWTHGLTLPFLIGSFVLGWLVAFLVAVAGDYKLTHQLPTTSTIGTYLIGATLIGAFVAFFLAVALRRIG